jgi:hypothetical protein
MSTAFVTLCDYNYWEKAKKTILQLRGAGEWNGNVVLISVDFHPDTEFMKAYDVQEYFVHHINTDNLVKQLQEHPIKRMQDDRQFKKLTQWDKLYAFHPFFKQWERIVFLDAGIHIFNNVDALLSLPWRHKLLAPDDSGPYDNKNRFRCQLDIDANVNVANTLFKIWPKDILDQKYFLNCIFVYDTALQDMVSFQELVNAMNTYPICLCNEMGIMNLIFTFTLNVWSPFPVQVDGKYLFGWCQLDFHGCPSTSQFHFIKYPV